MDLHRVSELLYADTTLCILLFVSVLAAAMTQYLGYKIIKYQNAVEKITVTLAMVPIVWAFFMVWPFKGQERFDAVKMIAIVIVLVSTFWFVYEDRQREIEMEDREKKDLEETPTIPILRFKLRSPANEIRGRPLFEPMPEPMPYESAESEDD